MDRSKSPTTHIRTLYSIAMRQKRTMNCIQGDQYYELEKQLKETLKKILAIDFTLLSKTQLINFLCLCSSHRPTEPVWILVDLHNRWKERQEREARA